MLAVETQGLNKQFGKHTALDSLDLVVKPGEIVGLLGSNGAGKSTTLKLLLGLLSPSTGEACVFGLNPVTQPAAVKGMIGYVADEPTFYEFLTGRETLVFIARVRKETTQPFWSRVNTLAETLDFESDLDNVVGTYSLGMRKKLALLCAMAHAPRLLLLDEPCWAGLSWKA